jgi:hypothetical protein
MTPQNPPPNGYNFAASRTVIATTFYATLEDAKNVHDEMKADDQATSPGYDGVIDTLWAYENGEWKAIDEQEFPPRQEP